jgi:hypothetical protein
MTEISVMVEDTNFLGNPIQASLNGLIQTLFGLRSLIKKGSAKNG